MKLTDEQISSIMQKNVTCKTILVTKKNESKVKNEYKLQGWKFVNKSDYGDKIKLTFQK